MKSILGNGIVMERHKPYIAMLFIQFIYAGMALFSKVAISKGMNSYVFVVYRQAFATVALAPFAFFLESNKTCPLSYNLICKIFMVSLCGYGLWTTKRLTLSLNLYYAAINYIPATFAAATTNAIPVITFVMAAFLRMEIISLKRVHGIAKVLGSVLGVSGALVYAFVKGPAIRIHNCYPSIDELRHHHHQGASLNAYSRSGDWIKGALIMISANILWSLWLILQTPIVKQYPSKLRLTTLQCFFSFIQSATWSIAVERNPSAWKLGWDVQLLSVAYCGIVVTGITYWLQVWAIQKKGPVFTAMFTPLALLITAIFSVLLWKETLHWGSIGGAVLLVGGLYGVLWGKNKEEEEGKRSVIYDQENAEPNQENKVECITDR